jgi:biotin operon repressor
MRLSLTDFLEQGPASSREIQAATGMSQAAVSRHLQKLAGRLVTVRTGRTPIYHLTKNAFGGGDRLPLFMVDAGGNITTLAFIRPLVSGRFYVEALPGAPELLLGESGDGLYDGLPYFLHDMSPQGFLGRQIAREVHERFPDFPPDPKWWTADHIGRFLLANGDDQPGNLIFGEQAALRVRKKPEAVDDAEYARMADKVMAGEIPGSSAGGEQPKFAVFSKHRNEHVIVKFSPPGDTETARRWRDIIITEFHALETLRKHGLPAAEARLLEEGERLFLESRRFDRTGEHGRSSMISLAAIDAEFVGVDSNWPLVLQRLCDQRRIDREHVAAAERLWCFGKLINNTDMHLGNMSFAMHGARFEPLPAYDMCSMGFAPKSGGELAPYAFVPRLPEHSSLTEEGYEAVRAAAECFWDSVAQDTRISREFREFLTVGNPAKR